MTETKQMRQLAPYPSALEKLVASVRYREGWRFTLVDMDRGQGSEGLTLIINVISPDAYEPSRTSRVNHYMIVPPAAFDERAWCRWLFEQVLLVEQHEAAEFFELNNARPFAPHHAPGRNPYSIVEQGTAEDATTDYLGKRFKLENGRKVYEAALKDSVPALERLLARPEIEMGGMDRAQLVTLLRTLQS